jgi:galactokinase
MAIDRWTEIRFTPTPGLVQLNSTDAVGTVRFDLPYEGEPSSTVPTWGRHVAAVAAELGPAATGISGTVSTSIPIGAGLSSSAALHVAVARALGAPEDPHGLAQMCRRAEFAATGVPTGILDQLCITAALDGHAMVMDCHTLTLRHLPLPEGVDVVVRFIAHRTLEGSRYSERVSQCAAAQALIGPLRLATEQDLVAIRDPVIRSRARHVITENQRVVEVAEALDRGDVAAMGSAMVRSHHSLRDQFAVSTPTMDAAVERLCATNGVLGARMTGGGFGGCVVALCEPGALDEGWVVRAVGSGSVV